MKNKLIAVAACAVFFSGSAFAEGAVKKASSKAKGETVNSRTMTLERKVEALQNKLDAMEKSEQKTANDLGMLAEMYAHGPAVVTSPALGVRRSADNAKDLMVNLPSINEDLVLLKLRQKMDNYATEHGIPIPERPIIAVSGYVEGKVEYKQKYQRTKRTDVDLSGAELDVIGEASPWATAAMIVTYNNSNPDDINRVKDSKIKLDRGFLTIGQLNKFPLYLTVGQVFAPFGTYSSYMLTDTSTKKIGRVKDRMLIAGYSVGDTWGSVNAQVYGFPGETKVADHNFFQHTGFNLSYEYLLEKFNFSLGASIIGNIAESEGMQDNVFAKTDGTESITSKVCGLDVRAKVGYDMFTLLAEYTGATKKFDAADLSFNSQGAKPRAFNIEGAVEFNIYGKPNTFAIGYGRTWQALALNLPKHDLFAMYNVSLIKNTILSFEYRHDINYNWGDEGKGKGSDSLKVNGTGRHQNIFRATLGVYF